jgi:hypothetical protein
MLMIAMVMIVMLTKKIETNLRLNAETGTDRSLYTAVHSMMLNWAGLNNMLDRMMGSSVVAMVCSSSSMGMILIVCSMVCAVSPMVGSMVVTAWTIG